MPSNITTEELWYRIYATKDLVVDTIYNTRLRNRFQNSEFQRNSLNIWLPKKIRIQSNYQTSEYYTLSFKRGMWLNVCSFFDVNYSMKKQ